MKKQRITGVQGISVIFMCVWKSMVWSSKCILSEKEHLFYTNKKRCGKMICIMNSQDKHIRS